jgi:hypothetical protein
MDTGAPVFVRVLGVKLASPVKTPRQFAFPSIRLAQLWAYAPSFPLTVKDKSASAISHNRPHGGEEPLQGSIRVRATPNQGSQIIPTA